MINCNPPFICSTGFEKSVIKYREVFLLSEIGKVQNIALKRAIDTLEYEVDTE